MSRIRQSLFLPILIGAVAILCTIAILVGWSIVFTKYYSLWKKLPRVPLGVGYWFLLAIGCMLLVGIMLVLVLQLMANIEKTLYVRQQDTFIDGVTHEFKSPLASLRLCLETMEMRELTPEMQQRFVGMMKKDVERLIAFVEHILESGRLEHNQREIRYQMVSIPELCRHCAAMIRERYHLSQEELACQISLDDSHEMLETDAVACETILMNLLDNAVKYSEKPVAVRLDVTDLGGKLSMKVSDHGIGIPKRLLKKIFHRFFRVPQDGRVVARGTGLGLYVVASLVRRLGGQITAFSEGASGAGSEESTKKGSTFEVLLPLLPAEMMAVETPRGTSEEPRPQGGVIDVAAADSDVDKSGEIEPPGLVRGAESSETLAEHGGES